MPQEENGQSNDEGCGVNYVEICGELYKPLCVHCHQVHHFSDGWFLTSRVRDAKRLQLTAVTSNVP